MSFRRRLSWSTAMRDYRTESRPAATPLILNGRPNLSGIMRKAVSIARSTRMPGWSWQRRMAVGLKTVWGWAKREIAETARRAAPVANPSRPWRSETDLMARLTKAQNRPENRAVDIMTFAGMCDSRAELEAHVTRYEHRVA